MSKTALVWSDVFLEHETGHHPERKERLIAIRRELETRGQWTDREILTPTSAEPMDILSIHAPHVVDRVRIAAERGGEYLDPDTIVSPRSFDVALLAVGAGYGAVDAIMTGARQRVFVLARPPGHHAEPMRSMGFCLFNTVALAAQYALDRYRLQRVSIIDFDVHHGNGTQAAFWERADVQYISLHHYPFYPGSGARAERGRGAGEGTTLNIPLPAGTGDEMYLEAMQREVVPAIEAFAPELQIVSAGFDAHEDDPLGGMRVSTEAFGEWARMLKDVAERMCAGRMLLILEGGYDQRALSTSISTVLSALDED